LAFALPLVVDGSLAGTCFVGGVQLSDVALVTALHLVGARSRVEVGLPPHGGNVSAVQQYPLLSLQTWQARLVVIEPLLDLAVLVVCAPGASPRSPNFIRQPGQVGVGDEVAVLGYPFAPIGSLLETFEACTVSAVAERVFPGLPPTCSVRELLIAHHTHPGSSGSPVVRRSDGAVCGVVRGCLAPPGVLSLGGLPLGTDTSVTYAVAAHVIPSLVQKAFSGSP
jgi:hypothetical protein